jgi:hypothetical protein
MWDWRETSCRAGRSDPLLCFNFVVGFASFTFLFGVISIFVILEVVNVALFAYSS